MDCPTNRSAHRRRPGAAGALALALVLTACGGDDDADGSSTTPDSTRAAAPATTDGAAAGATTQPTVDPPGDTTTETEPASTEPAATETPATAPPATLVVETGTGSYEVPAEAQRVVVVDPIIALPTALDLGASVIATTYAEDGGSPNALIDDAELDGLAEVGVFGGPTSIEAIAAASPDLIIASPTTVDEFELVAQIAPSVPFVVTGEWRDDARIVAETLGATDLLDEQLAAYDERADELADRIDAAVGDPTVAVVRVRPDAIRVHTNVHFAGNILSDAGLRIPDRWFREPLDDPIANARNRIVEISPELLGDLADADHVIVLPLGRASDSPDDVQAALDQVTSNPLWQALPAVQAGNVLIGDRHWLAGSRRAAIEALDDLERYLLDG